MMDGMASGQTCIALVKSIVNAHGAQLVIRSMPGIGTTVRISWNSK